MFEFLSAHRSTLKSIKVYNNIMSIVAEKREIPYMLQGTKQLARCLWDSEDLDSHSSLQSLELHGFFLHSEDLPELCRSLSKCTSLEQLFLSNNNLQDYGVSFLAKVLSRHSTFKLRQLTLYNNNIGDFGA